MPKQCVTCSYNLKRGVSDYSSSNHSTKFYEVDCSADVCPHGINRIKEGIL